MQKKKINSMLYIGMSVTNMIKDDVVFNNNEWAEIPLTNEEIESKLKDEKDKAFLSFRLSVAG